jgi:hypothetical protein
MSDWTIQPAKRVAKPFSRWVCVLAAAAAGALAGPALARAASSPIGLGDAQAQVESALAQVDAVAPGAGTAVQPAVTQAFTMAAAATTAATQPPAPAPNPAPAAAPPAPPAAPAAPAPAQIVSDAVAPVLTALDVPTSSVPFIVSPGRGAGTEAPSHTPISPAAPKPAAHAAVGSTRAASVNPAAAGAAFQAAALTTPRAAPAGEPPSSRSSRRGRSGATPAGAVLPQRPLPPVPPGPGQDVTAPAQAGGQGQLVPLLVAALAAALVFSRFPFRTRLLPRSAFRRPRRVVLPVWVPG